MTHFGKKKANTSEPSPKADSLNTKNQDALLYPTSAKYARRRKQRNVALVVTGVGLVGVLMLGIISFLGRVSGQFTIKMDPRVAPTNMKLFETVDGDEKTLITAKGLNNAYATSAQTVFEYVDTLKSNNTLNGSNNLSRKNTSNGEEENIDLALVFTFYAENTSKSEDATFDYSMAIDDYVEPTNSSIQPYSYLRVALFENLYQEDGNGSHDCNIYALESTKTNAAGDNREILSTFREVDRSPRYTYNDIGYCTPFEDAYSIFTREGITLRAKEKMRFTIVAWFEGNDSDCTGNTPTGSSMTFSVNFKAH